MTLLKMTANRTSAYPAKTEEMIRRTHIGMAHFAGTGPDHKTCRECVSWLHKSGDYYKSGTGRVGMLKPAPCALGNGKPVPFDARACNKFEESKNPPAISGR